MKKFTGILLAILSLCSCNKTESRTLTQQDSGQTVFLNIGENATIQLEENPTTGYSWQFFTEPKNQDIIGNITENYKSDQAEKGMVGVGGVKMYRFTALKTGSVVITGYYFRPWENKDTDSISKVSYKLEIK